MFKPEIPEKYDGRLNPAEFLSIYTIAIQVARGRDEKVFANYSPLAFKPKIPEKYDGRLNPAEFLSIYTIAV